MFSLVESVLPADAADAVWLTEIKKSAIRGQTDWKLKLNAYLHGLTVGKAARPEAVALVRHNIDACPEKESWGTIVVLPMLWPIVISIVVMGNVVLTWSGTYYWIALSLVAMVAGATTWRLPWLSNLDRYSRVLIAATLAGYLSIQVFSGAWLTSGLVQALSQRTFQQEWRRLSGDPQGFPMLRSFARDNYAVEVILGDVNSGWAETEMKIPGNSPASMSLQSGYCQMNMNRTRVLREFGPALQAEIVLWTQGVMMHEFAHCLDTKRDMRGFNGQSPSTFALAPSDAKGVTDVRTYIAATERASTMLWREALADIFAVGYWRLSASPEEAAKLALTLRGKRSVDSAAGDRAHATMCWIDQAVRSPLPGSYKDLMKWSDGLRSAGSCSTRSS